MGRSRYKITQADQVHFLTLTVLHWIPVFTRPESVTSAQDMPGKRGYWRFVGNGKSGMHSHAGAWERGISLLFSQIERLCEYKTTLINSAVTGKIKVPEVA